jgi:hypothetical protein
MPNAERIMAPFLGNRLCFIYIVEFRFFVKVGRNFRHPHGRELVSANMNFCGLTQVK